MDMNTLNPGQDFDDLPESYVIFITRDDASWIRTSDLSYRQENRRSQ